MASAIVEREFFTPPEIARMLGIKPDKVLGWISQETKQWTGMMAKPCGIARLRSSP